MNLPNLANTILRFAQPIIKNTIVQTIVDHLPINIATPVTINATVTVPTEKELQQVEIDTALSYTTIYTPTGITIDNLFFAFAEAPHARSFGEAPMFRTSDTLTTTIILNINDTYTHQGIEYKIVKKWNRSDYGYSKALGEEVQ